MAFQIKRHDLRPRYRIQLTETEPVNTQLMRPVNLTGATAAYFSMKRGVSGPAKVSRGVMDFIDASTGVVEYTWVVGDTDTAGEFNAEIEVDWSGEPQTFPSFGYFIVTIDSDLA